MNGNQLSFTGVLAFASVYDQLNKNTGIKPIQDLHKLPTMSSPLKRHTKHLAANIRNLLYRLYPQGIFIKI